MSEQTSENIVTQTKKWLSTFINTHNICPFAKREFDNDRISYEVINEDRLEKKLEALVLICQRLDTDTSIETSLVIYPQGLEDFDDYLDFLAIANALLEKQAYEGVYQLASFHPDYCFDGIDSDDASNYTNRSPFPMLHLIREESLERVLSQYPNPEKIPERNIEYTRELGRDVLKALLLECKNI